MRVILLVLALIALPTQAEVQPFESQLPMMCGDTKKLLDGLKERYQEEIVFLASSENSVGDGLFHSLWINYGNQTWSFIVVNKERSITCVLGSGENFSMFFPSASGS